MTYRPGQPCYLNFGLHHPGCQEAQPSMPGEVLEVTDELIVAWGEDHHVYTFAADRANKLALIAPRRSA